MSTRLNHIDLFEVAGFELVLVPDEDETLYVFNPADRLETFAYDARRLIENEHDFRSTWRTTQTRAERLDLLQHKAAVHLADYTREIDTETYTEDSLHVFALSKLAEDYLGLLVAQLARRAPLPQGPRCNRCIQTTEVIGFYDVAPGHGHHVVQHTIMHQCPACGQYRQTGFEDGSDWISDRMDDRIWVRLLPDPYLKTGRLRMTYEAGGQRLNLDGESFHAGDVFALWHNGDYRPGSIERGDGRFYFILSRTDETVDLLPGMRAKLLIG